jgi:hypothetical protein
MKILDDERYQSIGLSTIWDRTKIPCYGIGGGLSSCPGRVAILRSDNRLEYVPVELGSKCSLLPVHLNDTLICRTGGGGGYGDPLERDPELVLQDLQDLKVSELVAKEIYGVFIDKGRQAVDIDATKEQREKLKRAKIFCGVKKKDEEFIGNRRIVRLNPQLLNLLGYLPSESLPYLVELQGVSMAPLRLWTIEDEQYSHSEVGLDEASMRMLRINEGDRVWLRDPNWAERYVIATEEK